MARIGYTVWYLACPRDLKNAGYKLRRKWQKLIPLHRTKDLGDSDGASARRLNLEVEELCMKLDENIRLKPNHCGLICYSWDLEEIRKLAQKKNDFGAVEEMTTQAPVVIDIQGKADPEFVKKFREKIIELLYQKYEEEDAPKTVDHWRAKIVAVQKQMSKEENLDFESSKLLTELSDFVSSISAETAEVKTTVRGKA